MEVYLPESTTTERFIRMIRDRPAIWDRNCAEYSDKTKKEDSWAEIMTELYSEFDGWSDENKKEKTRLIVKRWGQMRDAFVKSEKKRHNTQCTTSLRKQIKPYRYHKEMEFVKPLIKHLVEPTANDQKHNNSTMEDIGQIEIDPRDKITYIKLEQDSDASYQYEGSSDESDEDIKEEPLIFPPKKRRTGSETAVNVKHTPSSSGTSSAQRHMSFFQGVTPSLERFNEDQILEFQIGVLKLIKQINNT